jgi:hypothetical protein
MRLLLGFTMDFTDRTLEFEATRLLSGLRYITIMRLYFLCM